LQTAYNNITYLVLLLKELVLVTAAFLFCSSFYFLALNAYATSSPLWQVGIALGSILNLLLPSPTLL
jgi:hypothetical protein